MAQQVKNLSSIQEDASSIPDFTQWIKDLALLQVVVWVTEAAQICCCLGCGVDCSYSSDLTPSPETSMCCRYGPKKKKKINVNGIRGDLGHEIKPNDSWSWEYHQKWENTNWVPGKAGRM